MLLKKMVLVAVALTIARSSLAMDGGISPDKEPRKLFKAVKISEIVHNAPVMLANFSHCGMLFVTTSSDNTTKVWETNTGKELCSLDTGPIYSISFSHGGRWLITNPVEVTDSNSVWDRVTGQKVSMLGRSVNSTCCTRIVQPIAAAYNDGTVVLYDEYTEEELFTIDGHTQPVSLIRLSLCCRWAVTVSEDGRAMVWMLPPRHLLNKPSSRTRSVGRFMAQHIPEYLSKTDRQNTIDDFFASLNQEDEATKELFKQSIIEQGLKAYLELLLKDS